MKRLGYRDVLECSPEVDREKVGYILSLGSFELGPIDHATLSELAECPRAVRRVLRHGFLERPELWGDLRGESPRHCRESLEELGALLAESRLRLTALGSPSGELYGEILERWQTLTRAVIEGLRELRDGGEVDSRRPILAAYRRRACACVEALNQFLPPDDELAVEATEKLEHGETSLIWAFGVDRERIEKALWSVTDAPVPAADSGFVTWGVP